MSIAPCAPVNPTFGVVVFDPAAFKVQFPAFTTVADLTLQSNFTFATLQLNNSCGSRVKDANIRALLLNLLVAHVTALLQGEYGRPPQGVVGRINSATEGSVSVSAEFAAPPNASQAYYIQTKYGAQFWASTAVYRTMTYIPAPAGCGCDGNLTPEVIGATGNGCGYTGGAA